MTTATTVRYRIEADGFTRWTPALPGWEDRIRSIVADLDLRPGTEVSIYPVRGTVYLDGTVDTAGTLGPVHKVYVPA